MGLTLQQQINAHLPKMKYALLSVAGVACLNCISRADYNLFLFLFLYYHLFGIPGSQAEDNNNYIAKERFFMTIAYCASLIIDIAWFIIWCKTSGIVIIVLSSIELVFKVLIIGVLVILVMGQQSKQQPQPLVDKTEKS